MNSFGRTTYGGWDVANTDQFVSKIVGEAGYKNTGEIALNRGRDFAKSATLATFPGAQLCLI